MLYTKHEEMSFIVVYFIKVYFLIVYFIMVAWDGTSVIFLFSFHTLPLHLQGGKRRKSLLCSVLLRLFLCFPEFLSIFKVLKILNAAAGPQCPPCTELHL